MARTCQVTGKKPMSGNRVSHSNRKTRHKQLPNIHKLRFFLEDEKRWVTLRVSAAAVRTINKNGIAAVVRDMRASGQKI